MRTTPSSYRLNPYRSLPLRPKTAAEAASKANSPLRDLYTGDFDGGYFWERALLIRPAASSDCPPLSVAAWNDPRLWKHLYGDKCSNVTFFAEDAFGSQFGVRGGRVVQFDPETAALTDCAASVADWVTLVLAEPAYFTGSPILAAWESAHAPIQAGFRLVPKVLFMFGGEFHVANMACKLDVEGMRLRAQFWQLTKDLPDGEQVAIESTAGYEPKI